MSAQDTLDLIRSWCAADGLIVSQAPDGGATHIDTDDLDVIVSVDGVVVRHRFSVRSDAFSWTVPEVDEGGSTLEDMLAWVVDARWGPLRASSHRNGSGHDVVIECAIPDDGVSHNAFTAARCEVIKTRHILDRILTDDQRLHEAALAKVSLASAATTQPPVTVTPVQQPPSAPIVPTSTSAPWAPTHRVPGQGMSTWQAPDPSSSQGPHLDARLEVQVVEHRGDWARVVCSNGWSAWVDARTLESVTS
jgi:hypothetical protein